MLREFAEHCKRLFEHHELGHADLPSEAAELRALLEQRLLGFKLPPGAPALASWQACMQAMFAHFGVTVLDEAAIEACFTPGGGIDFEPLNRHGEPAAASVRCRMTV